MRQGIPTGADVLAELERAGGEKLQSEFGSDYDDACNYLFIHGLIETDTTTIAISEKGKNRLEDMRRIFPLKKS